MKERLGTRKDIALGLKFGLGWAIVCSAGLTVRRLVIGPSQTKAFGMSWTATVLAYFGTLLLGGLLFGALLPLRRHPLGAMLIGFLFVLPLYAVGTALIGAGTGQYPFTTGLWVGALVAGFAGSVFGLLVWGEEQKQSSEQDPKT